jgi:hypothetical protein
VHSGVKAARGRGAGRLAADGQVHGGLLGCSVLRHAEDAAACCAAAVLALRLHCFRIHGLPPDLGGMLL